MSITKITNDLIGYEKAKNKLEEDVKELNKLINQSKTALYEEMDNEGVGEIEKYGVKFSIKVEPQFTIESHNWNSDEFFNFLKQEGLEDIIKTEPKVAPQTRTRVLKEYIQEGKVLPQFINESSFATVKYSKPKVLTVKEIL